MLHTVVALNDIFVPEQASFSEIHGTGSWLSVREYQGERAVERLISTNPYDYLNPALTPGMKYTENSFNSHKCKQKQGVDSSDGEYRKLDKIQERTDG